MKKNLFFALAALVTLASCNKQGVEVTVPQDDDTTPVAMGFTTLNTTVDVKTKAIITEETLPTGSDVYVYGKVKNVYSNAGSLTAGTFDLVGTDKAGAAAKANGNAIELTETKYYADNVSYDFYAYYLGGATAGTIEEEGIIPVTIDGTQDIMAAYAQSTDDKATGELAGRADLLYSTWSARREITPNLNFNHLLSAITLQVAKGEGVEDAITVKSIEVTAPTTGTVNVIVPTDVAVDANNPTAQNAVAGAEDGTFVVPNANYTYTEAALTGTATKIGSLLLFPNETEYPVTIKYTQGDSAEEKTSSVIVTAKVTGNDDVTSFLPGVHYTVDIKIYGQSQIEFTTSITSWSEITLDTVDPDALPEAPVTPAP